MDKFLTNPTMRKKRKLSQLGVTSDCINKDKCNRSINNNNNNVMTMIIVIQLMKNLEIIYLILHFDI